MPHSAHQNLVNQRSNPFLSGLVLSYRFDEPSNVSRFDRSGNNFGLTDTNTVPTVTTGPSGLVYAVEFTSANSEVLSTPFNQFVNPSKNLVVSLWFNLKTFAALVTPACQYDWNVGGQRCWRIGLNNATSKVFFDTPTTGLSHSATISTATWYHILCWVQSGIGSGIRLNAGAAETHSNSNVDLNDVQRDLTIGAGRNNNNGSNAQYLDGYVAGFNFWKPTDQQLRWLIGPGCDQLYNGGNGMHIQTPY